MNSSAIGLPSELNLVTGATGLLGCRLVERLVQNGEQVRALVRPSSDTSRLNGLPLELALGDLTDRQSLEAAVKDVTRVYHCAAEVSDWGPRRLFQRANVDGTRNLVKAVIAQGTPIRFIHVSSTDVYGYPMEACDESHPMVSTGLPYNDTKIEAEKIVSTAVREQGLAATLVRPATIYGPRAWATVGDIAKNLEKNEMVLVGDGSTGAGLVYVDDVADAMMLAADSERALGRVYNLRTPESITWRMYVEAIRAEMGASRAPSKVPAWLLRATAAVGEGICRRLPGQPKPPLTRHALLLMSRDQNYDATRALRELSWRPSVSFKDGMREVGDWWRGLAAPG